MSARDEEGANRERGVATRDVCAGSRRGKGTVREDTRERRRRRVPRRARSNEQRSRRAATKGRPGWPSRAPHRRGAAPRGSSSTTHRVTSSRAALARAARRVSATTSVEPEGGCRVLVQAGREASPRASRAASANDGGVLIQRRPRESISCAPRARITRGVEGGRRPSDAPRGVVVGLACSPDTSALEMALTSSRARGVRARRDPRACQPRLGAMRARRRQEIGALRGCRASAPGGAPVPHAR